MKTQILWLNQRSQLKSTVTNKDSKIKSENINQINFDQRRKRRYCGEKFLKKN